MPSATPHTRSGRRRNPRGQGGKLREELIEAATRLMSDGGREDQISVRAVTRAAGVAPQSFYLHFDKIDDLLWEVYTHEYAALTAALATAADSFRDPRARLRAICHAYCRFADDRPASYALMFFLTGRTDHDWHGELPGAASTRLLVESVQACRPGVSTAANAQTASLLWASLHGLVTLRKDRPAYPWRPLKILLDELLSGLVSSAN